MNFKQILCLLIALTLVSPVMAKSKKKKPPKGKLISISAEELVVKIKKEKKTYKLTEDTKIINLDGDEVAPEDCKFKVVVLTVDPDNDKKITEVKEFQKKKKKKNKKKAETKVEETTTENSGDDTDS